MMNHSKHHCFLISSLLLLIVSCGGGGGGGSYEDPASSGSVGGSTPAPISGSTQAIALTFSASSSDVELNGSVTLTWAGTNATSCDASGAWGGNNKAASGSETVNMTLVGTQTFSVVCKNSADSVTASTSVEVYQIIGGIVLDGYIRGAEVFVDRNNNLTLDSNESSVTTDNSGAFSNLRMYDGNLVTKNGTDLDTGFILENFSLQAKTTSDKTAYIVSPVTTIGAYLSNPADVNNILGISSDIDVYSVDPIPLLDDAKHAALYSIGNRLTVLAMSIQKFEGTNKDLNAYLNVIATEAQTSYDASTVSVQMDDPDFVRSVLNTALGTSTADDFKTNLSTMLSNSLYLLQVKDNSAATTGIQNFAFTTLQDDITKLKNCSSASSCAVMNNYTNDVFGYVAGDQNLALSDVTIPIQAFADVLEVNEDTELSFLQATLLANDYYLKGTGNTFVFTDAANGSFLSADAGSFRYLPNLNFNGADTFSYTIGQAGEESTGTVTINVAPVNDNPTVIARDFLSIGGGTAVFNNVGANDIDGDALSYTISGTDAQYISVAGNGDLSFTNAVSYANPSDGNGDNIYEFTVAVSDGGTSVTQSFQVEVKPGGSAPVWGIVSDTSFYNNSPITIQITASDPDGDTISASISEPSGFSIASNANGFEITNSSGLAAGTYNVQGVITDNNFNTSFGIEIRVKKSPTNPPALGLNGSLVSQGGPSDLTSTSTSGRRNISLFEGNRTIGWGWSTGDDRPTPNWDTDHVGFDAQGNVLAFDNARYSLQLREFPEDLTMEISFLKAIGGLEDLNYENDQNNKLFEFNVTSNSCESNIVSSENDGRKISFQFNGTQQECILEFSLSYNRKYSWQRIIESGKFSTTGAGSFHARMARVEPNYSSDEFAAEDSEGPYQFLFDIKTSSADKEATYNFYAVVRNINEPPYLSTLNANNLSDEYIYTDCSSNPYSSCIEYAPTLKINVDSSRQFEFFVGDDNESEGLNLDFKTFSDNHFQPEFSGGRCTSLKNRTTELQCTAEIPQSIFDAASSGDILKTVLVLRGSDGNATVETHFPVYLTINK